MGRERTMGTVSGKHVQRQSTTTTNRLRSSPIKRSGISVSCNNVVVGSFANDRLDLSTSGSNKRKAISLISEKRTPMNPITDNVIHRIADTLIGWKEEEKLSRIVDLVEHAKNDYNISPRRNIHTSDAET